jgi:hypothetical protein
MTKKLHLRDYEQLKNKDPPVNPALLCLKVLLLKTVLASWDKIAPPNSFSIFSKVLNDTFNSF